MLTKLLTGDFLTMFTISLSLSFDGIAKYGVIFIAYTISVSNIWKMSKIP